MWKTVRLGDVCDLIGGGTPRKRNVDYEKRIVCWATARDVALSELLYETERKITVHVPRTGPVKIIPKGNVIIAISVSLGKVCILQQDTAINRGLCGVIPKKDEEIDVRFLFYWFKSIAKDIILAGRGTTVQGVALPFLKSLILPFPPLAEQRSVVAKLDAAFAEIDTATVLSNVKSIEIEKLKSSLSAAELSMRKSYNSITCKTVKLGDVCDLIGGGTPRKRNIDYEEGTICWATVRDMAPSKLYETERKITAEGLKTSSAKIIPKGNVIIASRVGLGKVCILQQDTAINQDLRGVLPKKGKEIDTKFLYYWFKNVAKDIISAGRGATVQGVTLPFLNSLLLPLPPLAEQQRIVAKLDAVFNKLETARLSIQYTKSNYASLKSAILVQEMKGEEM